MREGRTKFAALLLTHGCEVTTGGVAYCTAVLVQDQRESRLLAEAAVAVFVCNTHTETIKPDETLAGLPSQFLGPT